MATKQEVDQKISDMTEEEFAKFQKAFGPDRNRRDWYGRHLIQNPSIEAKLCDLLALKTEAEKAGELAASNVRATERAASAAEASAKHAEEANQIAQEANELARQAQAKAEEANRIAHRNLWIAILSAAISILSAAAAIASAVAAFPSK